MPSANSVPFLPLWKSSMESEEYEHAGKVEDHITPESRPPRSRFFTWARAYVLVLHILVVTLIIAISANGDLDVRYALEQQRSWCRYRHHWAMYFNSNQIIITAPVQEFVEYELNGQHATNHTKYTKYSGYPTPDQDEAWRQLMKRIFLLSAHCKGC